MIKTKTSKTHKLVPNGVSVLLLLITFVVYLTSLADEAVTEVADFEVIAQFTDDVVLEVMDEENLVGTSIALVYQGEQLLSKGYGLASKRESISYTNETSTSLHEFAMLFTAVGVMQLVERGEISLEAPLNQYMPNFKPFAGSTGHGDFTIRQMLSHHSGLPYLYRPNYIVERSGQDGLPVGWDSAYKEILSLSGNIALVSSTGQVYEYSQLAYTMLGLLIEETTGLGYRDYIRLNILQPLNMSSTYFGAEENSISTFSESYRGSKPQAYARLYRDLPANGLVSNAVDMALFSQAIIAGGAGIISSESLEQMFSTQNDDVPEDDNFRTGLGFVVTPATGGPFLRERFISHESSMGTSRSYLVAYPDHQMSVLFTSNTNLDSLTGRGVVDRIMEKMLNSVTELSPTPYTPHREIEIDDIKLNSLVGGYVGVGGAYYIKRRGNSLRLDVPYAPFLKIKLIPREDDYYGGTIRLFGFMGLGWIPQMREIAKTIEGRVIEIDNKKHITMYMNGVSLVTLTEIEPSTPSPAFDSWMTRTSDYDPNPGERKYALKFDKRSSNFSFGQKKGLLPFATEPPELYCVESAVVLRRCGQGLEGNGVKNVLRIMEDDRLLDAYGRYYSVAN